MSLFAITVSEIRTEWILRAKLDCKKANDKSKLKFTMKSTLSKANNGCFHTRDGYQSSKYGKIDG